jgi:hypothetical protein
MGKYDPLGAFLRSRDADETPMTFEEVEAVIGAPLPPAAARHPAWWSNNPRNNVMTRVWLDAGFRTERVDLSGGKLVFRRVAAPAGPTSPAAPPTGPRRGVLEALRRELGGTVRVRPGVDLTAPTGEAWDAEA